jgi:hypothetical protein
MGLPDPHDPRLFQKFVRLNDDGTIAAVLEVSDAGVAAKVEELQDAMRTQKEPGQADKIDAVFGDHAPAVHAEITDLKPFDTARVKIKKGDLSDPAKVDAAIEAVADTAPVKANAIP